MNRWFPMLLALGFFGCGPAVYRNARAELEAWVNRMPGPSQEEPRGRFLIRVQGLNPEEVQEARAILRDAENGQVIAEVALEPAPEGWIPAKPVPLEPDQVVSAEISFRLKGKRYKLLTPPARVTVVF